MKGLKKLSLLLVMMLTTTLLYGCGGPSPTDVVNEYFKKMQNGDMDVQKLFAMAEEGTKEENVESDSFSEDTQKKLLEKMKAITYKVNSETVDGDNAKVNVTVKGMDLNIVLAKVMQEAFSFILSQAFSGVEMSEEENNAYFDSLLNKYLDEITYSERTSDVLLTKVDKEWKIEESEALSKLLIGIDSSTFSDSEGGTGSDSETPVATKEMTLNTPLLVETENGNYNLTIEGARATDKRNEFSEKEVKQVVFLDYTYENVSFDKNDLYIDEYAFQVLDDEGNVLDTYPVYDENRTAKDTPVGGKCIASGTFAVPTDSKNLNVTFVRGSQKVAKIIVPIN
ncbi:DUF4878 domain-containing protein [Clostridium sp. C8]|uniref:DUF4878 domain-containing protein n=1 Tax=Clostridium sp. C8 TaxID=1667357 RepID=UPI00062E5593|nr:DUF4878 domain-containing protein [Clostridium sp. C8]KLE15974.1 hypothetical protein AAT22_08560 [Clostridium sp. C8]